MRYLPYRGFQTFKNHSIKNDKWFYLLLIYDTTITRTERIKDEYKKDI